MVPIYAKEMRGLVMIVDCPRAGGLDHPFKERQIGFIEFYDQEMRAQKELLLNTKIVHGWKFSRLGSDSRETSIHVRPSEPTGMWLTDKNVDQKNSQTMFNV